MIVGHAPLAFTVVAILLVVFTKRTNKQILFLATTAAIAAIMPDVDIFFPILSLFAIDQLTINAITTQFWDTSSQLHRMATHSLVILGAATLTAFANQYTPTKYQTYTLTATTAIVILLPTNSSIKLVTLITLFTVHILTTYKPKTVTLHQTALAFTFGTLTHPLGDMFTGTPPAVLYPFTDVLELSRWTIADPTLQFVLVFTLEIGSLIAALALIAHLTEIDLITYTDIKPKPHHALISTLALALVLFTIGTNTTPTVDSATTFVLPLVGTTTLATTPTLLYKKRPQQYLSDISWTLLFAIIAFTLYYTTTLFLI